jgi:hypothetical protein
MASPVTSVPPAPASEALPKTMPSWTPGTAASSSSETPRCPSVLTSPCASAAKVWSL